MSPRGLPSPLVNDSLRPPIHAFRFELPGREVSPPCVRSGLHRQKYLSVGNNYLIAKRETRRHRCLPANPLDVVWAVRKTERKAPSPVPPYPPPLTKAQTLPPPCEAWAIVEQIQHGSCSSLHGLRDFLDVFEVEPSHHRTMLLRKHHKRGGAQPRVGGGGSAISLQPSPGHTRGTVGEREILSIPEASVAVAKGGKVEGGGGHKIRVGGGRSNHRLDNTTGERGRGERVREDGWQL